MKNEMLELIPYNDAQRQAYLVLATTVLKIYADGFRVDKDVLQSTTDTLENLLIRKGEDANEGMDLQIKLQLDIAKRLKAQ